MKIFSKSSVLFDYLLKFSIRVKRFLKFKNILLEEIIVQNTGTYIGTQENNWDKLHYSEEWGFHWWFSVFLTKKIKRLQNWIGPEVHIFMVGTESTDAVWKRQLHSDVNRVIIFPF